MRPIFCKLSHNASILAEGYKLTIYGMNPMTQSPERATFEIEYRDPIVDMVNVNEGEVHILTEREVLLLISSEPHAQNFMISRSWPR